MKNIAANSVIDTSRNRMTADALARKAKVSAGGVCCRSISLSRSIIKSDIRARNGASDKTSEEITIIRGFNAKKMVPSNAARPPTVAESQP